MESRKLPQFANETEEAQWWFDNRELIGQDFEKAGEEGRLRVRTLGSIADLSMEAVRPNPEDAALARKQAASEGIEYQDYLKRVIHEAVVGREKRA